jgi:hypothetical protein
MTMTGETSVDRHLSDTPILNMFYYTSFFHLPGYPTSIEPGSSSILYDWHGYLILSLELVPGGILLFGIIAD